MARSQEESRELIDEAVDAFRSQCLLDDGSLLFNESARVWTTENLDELHKRLIEEYIGGTDQDFSQKLEQQLSGAPEVARLTAETLVVYSLFASRRLLSPATKRNLVRTALRFGGVDESEINEDSVAWRALDEHIGHPGGRYNMRRHEELSYVIQMTRAFKALDASRQRELLNAEEPWAFQEWLDSLEVEHSAGSRHILLHLLWPDYYERIASGGHKHRIARVYGSVLGEGEAAEEDIDKRLLAIRSELRKHLDLADEEVDFYRSPLNEWLFGAPEDQDALRHKGQLVFYGPPGTSKTYDAEHLAEGLIRAEATRIWGIDEYLRRQAEVPKLVESHTHSLQFHPAYSYEDFIGGLQLGEGGRTEYVPGYLPRLCERIEDERKEVGANAIPHVLIIDEMNRADLSRVFGEAFSRIEKNQRGRPITLTGGDPTNPKPPKLTIPADLYVIGTMNLIDQSVEQLDFALRRRFLWRHAGFDAARLLEILEEVWAEEPSSVPWERVSADMEALSEAARRLNRRIAELDLLGPQYEVGHTYFLDIVPILKAQISSARQRVFLWRGSGQPADALESFWALSLLPLLEEYLAGLEQGTREDYVSELAEAFLKKP